MGKDISYRLNVIVPEKKVKLFTRVMSQFNISKQQLDYGENNYIDNGRSYEFVFDIKNSAEKDRVLDTCLLSKLLYGCKPVLV